QAAAGGAPVAGGAEGSGTGLPPDSGKNRSSGGDCSSAAEGAAGSLRIGPVRSEPLHRDSLLSHQMRLLHVSRLRDPGTERFGGGVSRLPSRGDFGGGRVAGNEIGRAHV